MRCREIGFAQERQAKGEGNAGAVKEEITNVGRCRRMEGWTNPTQQLTCENFSFPQKKFFGEICLLDSCPLFSCTWYFFSTTVISRRTRSRCNKALIYIRNTCERVLGYSTRSRTFGASIGTAFAGTPKRTWRSRGQSSSLQSRG